MFGTRTVLDKMGALYCEAASTWQARRIVAALNAVDGIPTEALEELPGDVVSFCKELTKRLGKEEIQ